MKKKFLSIMLGSMLFAMSPVSAQEVTVDGFGIDRASALKDAERNAIETVVGTLIDSQTIVSKAEVMLDDIYSKSHGFVRKSKIISEGSEGDSYRVKATIDVDTDPNAELIDKLTMLMRLNDPRIAVIIFKDGTKENDEITEEALNEKLLDLDFTHLVDADHVIKMFNADFLNAIYDDQHGLIGIANDHSIDYLVIGKSKLDTMTAQIPDGKGGLKNSVMQNTLANINAKIIKFDTGDLVGTFRVEGNSNGNQKSRSEQRALENAASKAAEKLEEKFKKLGAKNTQGIQIQFTASDYSKVNQLVQDLQSVTGVQSAVIRDFRDGKGIIDVDSSQAPRTLVAMLRRNSTQNFRVDGITGNVINLSIM